MPRRQITSIGRNGVAYVGVLGGLLRIADTP
jgi:hypothetical protein